VTDAMRIDSSGMVLQDERVTIKAEQIDLSTSIFNVPVEKFTVDGPNGVKFEVSGSTGNTVMRGDLLIGGSDVPGLRSLTMASSDDSVVATLSAVDATQDATIRLTDAGGNNAFDIMKDDTVLKVQAANTAGVIEINPGITGSLRVNTDKLSVDGGSGDTSIRGDVTIGGTSVLGVRAVAIESNNDDVSLTLTAGGDGEEAKLSWNDGTRTFDMAMTGRDLVLSANEDDGRVQITPGTVTGRLTIGPDSPAANCGVDLNANCEVNIATATANTYIGGDLNVEGKSSLNKLDIESGLATGSTGQTIDKATGIVTSSPSTLPPYTPNSVTSVTLETIVMDNNRVTPSSVIVASIVQNCNPDTLLTVVETTPAMGSVTFKVANVGAVACASETFNLAYVVLN